MTAKRKLGRSYTLKIQATNGPDIIIELPYTLELQVSRNILSSVNNGSFRIYNLGAKVREQIRKDSKEYFLSKRVELLAGYGNARDVIFAGNILSAFSQREGTNFITQIEAFDGGFGMTNTLIKKTYGKNTKYKNIVSDMMLEFSQNGIGRGVVGEIEGTTSRGSAFDGNAFDQLRDLTGGGVFIDNEKINVLSDDEYIGGSVPVITSNTGLLGTPKIEGARLSFDMVFEPKLLVGQKIEIKSSTQGKLVNSKFYKVLGLRHSGMISESVSGSLSTSVDVFFGVRGLREVTQ